MSVSTKIFTFLLIILIAACTKTETTQNYEVKVIDDADTIGIDVANSVVTWIGSKPTGRHSGTINLESGNILQRKGEIIGGTFIFDIVSIDIKDVDIEAESKQKLYNHLLSDDFFDAHKFPTGTFKITAIKPYDSTAINQRHKIELPSKYKPEDAKHFIVDQPTNTILGELTLRGTTNSISIPTSIVKYENKEIIEAKFNIDRTKWNLNYGNEAGIIDKAKDKFIYNTVNVGFYLELPSVK